MCQFNYFKKICRIVVFIAANLIWQFINTAYAQIKSSEFPVYQSDTILFNGLTLSKPAHLAFDSSENALFISDPGKGSIYYFRKNTGDWKEIFKQRDAEPDFIALDQNLKIIYWTDRSDGSIWRANYDGSSGMRIFKNRKETPEYLFVDSPGTRLYYLANSAIQSINTVGEKPATVFSSKNFIISTITPSADKAGFIYLGIENNRDSRLNYNTIYLMDPSTRKNEPVVKNCTNVFTRIVQADNMLIWTGHDPGTIFFYDIQSEKIAHEIDVKHNVTDFVLDTGSGDLFFLAKKEKHLFVLSPIVADHSVTGTPIDKSSGKDSSLQELVPVSEIPVSQLVQDSLSRVEIVAIPKDTIETAGMVQLNDPDSNETVSEKHSPNTANYLRVHEIRIWLKSGLVLTMFLHDVDETDLYLLSTYYMSNEYPVLTGQKNLFKIPLSEVERIKIVQYFDIQTGEPDTNFIARKPLNSTSFIIYGGLGGLGLDLAILAAGGITFPFFTLAGGIGGLLVAAINNGQSTVSFRAKKVDKKTIEKNFRFKNGIREPEVKLLKNYIIKEITPSEIIRFSRNKALKSSQMTQSSQ